jgi:hypothetical protein
MVGLRYAIGSSRGGWSGVPGLSKGKVRGIHGGVKGLIRPWYRSRLFWLGVPGLVFLVWGWWKSGTQMVRFDNGINDSNPAVAFFFDEGCLMVAWEYDPDSEWHFEAEEAGTFQQAPNRPFRWLSGHFGYELEETGYHEFYVPLWLSVTTYSFFGLGALVVWRRFQTRRREICGFLISPELPR